MWLKPFFCQVDGGNVHSYVKSGAPTHISSDVWGKALGTSSMCVATDVAAVLNVSESLVLQCYFHFCSVKAALFLNIFISFFISFHFILFYFILFYI